MLAWLATADLSAAIAVARETWAPKLTGRVRRGERDVWVAGDPAAAVHRQLLAWSLITGAVVALPWRADRVDHPRVTAAAWLRATVFSGDGSELDALADKAATAPRWHLVDAWRSLLPSWREARHRPWGRLHTVAASEAVPEEPWKDRGVQVLQSHSPAVR